MSETSQQSIESAGAPAHRRRFRWIAGGLVGAVIVGATLGWWASLPDRPDAFYSARPSGAPGTVLRVEPFTRGVPAGARASRVLYATTDAAGRPAIGSAIVLAPRGPGPHPIVLWTHGTTGVAPGCAPSLLAQPFANVPALPAAIAREWVVVAPDYVGLGTPGPHPYLIGAAVARGALDAVRAAARMPDLSVGRQVAVWGHSQGGHAALWVGQLAPTYAPDVRLVGVAALAPATELPAMLRRIQGTPVGGIMSAYVLHAYAAGYPDVRIEDYVGGVARVVLADVASRCLDGRRAIASLVGSIAIGGAPFSRDPASGPFGRRLAENVPSGPIDAPVLIAQGMADELVDPELQAAYVRRRCADGQRIEFRRYPRADHLTLVAAGGALESDLVSWTAARFAGGAAPAGCVSEPEASES
jgi:acetyl esterase/lipase